MRRASQVQAAIGNQDLICQVVRGDQHYDGLGDVIGARGSAAFLAGQSKYLTGHASAQSFDDLLNQIEQFEVKDSNCVPLGCPEEELSSQDVAFFRRHNLAHFPLGAVTLAISLLTPRGWVGYGLHTDATRNSNEPNAAKLSQRSVRLETGHLGRGI